MSDTPERNDLAKQRQTLLKTGFSRRSVIKVTGAAGTLALIGGVAVIQPLQRLGLRADASTARNRLKSR